MATWFFARRIYLDAQVYAPEMKQNEVRRTTRRIQPINVDDTQSSEHVAETGNMQAEDEHEQDDDVSTESPADEESEYVVEVSEEDHEEDIEEELKEDIAAYESNDEEEYVDAVADEDEYYETEYDEEESNEYSYAGYEDEDSYEQETFEGSVVEEGSDIISQFKDAGWDEEEVELLAQLEREQKELERIAAEQHKSDENETEETAATQSIDEHDTVSEVESDSESRPSVILGPDGKSISLSLIHI